MFERLPPSKRFFTYILGFIICITFIFLFISYGVTNFYNKKYVVYFDHAVSGLKVGSSVGFKGVPVGLINSIEIENLKTDRVKVVIKISKKIKLYEGCKAKISMQGLTGYSILELNNTKTEKLLNGYMPEIDSEYSDIEKLFNHLPDIMSNGNDLIKSINDILRKNKKSINTSLNNFNNLILTMNKAFYEIHESAKVMKKLGINCEKNLLLPLKKSIDNVGTITQNWADFSKSSILPLMQLINNLNHISYVINDSIVSKKGYIGYILGTK
jgi:phospholipid/cholesterol/gamma-HCH transport system substrate-binding protein